MEACDGLMSKSGYQLLRDVTGGGYRQGSALKVMSKPRRSSKSPIKEPTTKKRADLWGPAPVRMSKSGPRLWRTVVGDGSRWHTALKLLSK